MKPAAFDYHRPDTVDAVLALLAAHGDDAALLAGGQSLVPMMNMRLARPAHLIDLNRLEGLAGARRVGSMIEVGALTRHADLARDPVLRRVCPLLAHAASTIGCYVIRQRGTLGGSLSMADPSAQLPLVAALLGAEIVLRSARGERIVASSAFFIAAMTTDKAEDELITSVRFPCLAEGETFGFQLFSERAGDYAIVLCTATVKRDPAGAISEARLALGGITSAPLVMADNLADHIGCVPDRTWPATVAENIARSIEPEAGGRHDISYKRDLSRALIERAFADALGADESFAA